MKKILSYKLFEERDFLLKINDQHIGEIDWYLVEKVIKEISNDFQFDKSNVHYCGAINIDPSDCDGSCFCSGCKSSSESVIKLMPRLFYNRNEQFLKIIIKYGLWVQPYPDYEELIFNELEETYSQCTEDDKKFINKIGPEWEVRHNKNMRQKDYNL